MIRETLSENPKIEIICGDCLEVLKTFEDNSIDCIITDPPAGIGFMGKAWDNFGKGLSAREKFIGWLEIVAKECLRVAKPGSHALVWALPKTSHWTATAWENAGWEVRDRIIHCFASGFPKNLSIGKEVDKLLGNERKEIGFKKTNKSVYRKIGEKNISGLVKITKGFSEWEGWGTALKPAVEDWWLLRKPSEKGLNIAENVLKWGTGGLNIDECRVGTEKIPQQKRGKAVNTSFMSGGFTPEHRGRFPSHLIIDDSEEVKSLFPNNAFRFFYCAKASRKERNVGYVKNNHPTVKPIKLMEYLVKLICPPNGIVLDPFMGSGSTGIACVNLNKNFIGIEIDKDYFEIAKKRIGFLTDQKKLQMIIKK